MTALIFIVAVALAQLSRIPLRLLAMRVWLGVLFFTGCIALPAVFTTPGLTIWHLPLLGWRVTSQGLYSAAHLLVRAETSATWVLLVVLCTSWTHVLKALRTLRFPVTGVVIFGMTHRYIFLLVQLAREQFEARRSRLSGCSMRGTAGRLPHRAPVCSWTRAYNLAAKYTPRCKLGDFVAKFTPSMISK